MDINGAGKSPNTSLSFRYNANNEELEELCDCEDDPPTPADASPGMRSENASPKKGDKNPSILDKYFKSMRTADKLITEKEKEDKLTESKCGDADESRSPPKEVTSSPVKDYLKNFGKRSVSESADVKDVGGNETWKIFHDFKFKIAQAVEDMKTRSLEETKEKEKSVPRDNSISDSEENSVIKDSDQSVGDTDNQVSSLNSSIQNLSEMTQPLTAKATEIDLSLPVDKNVSEGSDDTQKNLVQSETAHVRKDSLNETNTVEVESGVEALEDNIDAFSDAPHTPYDSSNIKKGETTPASKAPLPIATNFNHTPSQINYTKKFDDKEAIPFFSFTLYFLTFLVFVNFILFPEYNHWKGFLLGIWVFYFVSNFKNWVLGNYFGDTCETNMRSFFQLNRSSAMPVTYTIPSVKEYRPIKKLEGWINHYRAPEYDPLTYTINKTTTAFMKLEGCNLRISYTTTKIPKRALWDEKLEKVEFYQHRLYNLTGAKVILLPKGLVKRRQWSKKYPICIKLNETEKIQVLEKENIAVDKKTSDAFDKKKEQPSQHEMESTETNTSPEKKKKFVWRRKDKSNSTPSIPAPHTESEVGKEGLRHRLVRKKHKDKKSDSLSTAAEQNPEPQSPTQKEKAEHDEQTFHDAETDLTTKSNTSTKEDGEEELDETELTKIKEVLEQTELDATTAAGTSEGEWSVHVKHSIDNHAYLYIFTRTGRDKHEWFRRLTIAAAPLKSAETSAAEDKTGSELPQENKEGIEMAVYKVSEKDNVAFTKKDNIRRSHILADGGVEGPDFSSCEETFWPFLIRIIETHEMTNRTKSEVGVMCQLEPSPRKSIKHKKKAKEQKSQQQNIACDCRMLPSEVTWVNTVIARVIYDLVHNPHILLRMQARIQRKLATLKLPSFMSPLVVTDLSLAGACPLVERVCAPTWDERGVWLDADLRYDGGAYISILTQINLMKLKEKNVALEDQLQVSVNTENLTDSDLGAASILINESSIRRLKPAVFDSDVEDSAESSDDDDSPPIQPVDSNDNLSSQSEYTLPTSESTTPGVSSKKKFLRMVDKIAMNKYFQQVTEYKYVKRAMEGLSNTDIKLQLEVQGLEGRLTFNLPPPPHDRVWFGFRTNPQLVLKARPAVGARTLRFAQISNWIEQKLSKEFEKILVLPNMEDISLDVLTPTPIDGD